MPLAVAAALAVSAFPSVLMRHDVIVTEDGTQAPGWDTVRLPESLDTQLPEVGEWCDVGLYRYGEGWVYCRQAHTRQADWQPENVPALWLPI